MKSIDFEYQRPETLEATLALLADDTRDVQLLAGGQSLIPMMNLRMAAPEVLVDLGALGLSGVALRDGWLEIGAMTRYSALMRDDLVARHAPLMRLALPHVAHAAIRNRGTLGGSVALADPAAEMPAVLLALNAEIEVAGRNGRRNIAADDFFVGLYETDLDDGEIVTAIRIPVQPCQAGFAEVARRHGDYAMAGVALTVGEAGARVAFFGVADRALRAPGLEEALATRGMDQAALEHLRTLPFEGDLNASAEMKRHLAGVVLKRAFNGLA
ncbi:MAG: xanthine dehydrogenase family protein subunit M [Pseudomonadota bacterium]